MPRERRLHSKSDRPEVILGRQRIAVAEIAGRRLEKVSERDTAGAMLNAMLYMLAAVVFLFLIVEGQWSGRFIIAIAFFMAIALMAFSDVLTTKPIVYYRLHVTTRSGGAVVHATPDPGALAAFDAAVQRAMSGRA